MKKMNRWAAWLAAIALAAGLMACKNTSTASTTNSNATTSASSADKATEVSLIRDTSADAEKTSSAATTDSAPTFTPPDKDRAGNRIKLPQKVEKIVSLAPSISQEIIDLGLIDKLVTVDVYSAFRLPELAKLPQMDMMEPNLETLIALQPDLILVTNLTSKGGEDPLKPLIKAGICVAQIPTASSLEDIGKDVRFIADVVGEHEKGDVLMKDFDSALDKYRTLAKEVKEPKTVVFEVSPAPYYVAPGKGSYLNEMIELLGAKNVFADQKAWFSYSEEQAVAANPDVILTNADFLPDPVGEVLGRPGWENMKAIKDKAVYYIDNFQSSTPNQHVVEALEAMFKAIYPELAK